MGGGSSKVVEEWHAEDGSSWYRKWSSGYVEQGGTTNQLGGDARVSVVFPIAFSSVVLDRKIQREENSANWTPSFYKFTLTGAMVINNYSEGTPSKLNWYVAGY